jgi:hypothetical protein
MSPKRFLTICFLLFALAGNTAWAAVDYPAVSGDIDASDHAAGHQHDFPDYRYDGCDDHCCHAGAHFLGLLGMLPAWDIFPSSDSYLTSDQKPLSHPLSPLFEPPIV